MPREIYVSFWGNSEVDGICHYFLGQVAIYFVNLNPLANIYGLDERITLLNLESFVNLFIMFDSLFEVDESFLHTFILIILPMYFHFANILIYYILLGANRLNPY